MKFLCQCGGCRERSTQPLDNKLSVRYSCAACSRVNAVVFQAPMFVLLYWRAMYHAEEGDLRLAVLELETAWELCATAVLSQLFGPLSDDKDLQQTFRQLRPFPQDLRKLRNKVAHRGYLPGGAETYAFATEVWTSVNTILGSLRDADELGSRDLKARVDSVTQEMQRAGSAPEYIQTPTLSWPGDEDPVTFSKRTHPWGVVT